MDKKDIANKDFSRSMWGYNIQEVDAFLDEIIKEFERHESAMTVCQSQLKLLASKLVQLRGGENGSKNTES